jgi:hypothetical protein
MNIRKLILGFIVVLAASGAGAQVNLTSGAATFGLPIFSYNDGHSLSTNVSLSYVDGGGLPVGEVASAVGTGWQLQFGGVIRREQRGLPDDQRRSIIIQNPIPNTAQMTYDQYQNEFFPNGYLSTTFSPNDVIENEGGYVKMSSTPDASYFFPKDIPIKEKYAADREQDIFRLNFGQGAVEFIIGRGTGTTPGEIKILNDSKVKIAFVEENMLGVALNVKTSISKFIVTGLDGVQYTFADKELTRQCNYITKKSATANTYFTDDEVSVNSYGAIPPNPQIYLAKRSNSYIVSAWYLTEIMNPRTNKKIQFIYEAYDVDMPGKRIYTKSTISSGNASSSLTIARNVAKQLRIKTIICSPQTRAEFVYTNTDRADLPGDKALKEIQILENVVLQSKFSFDYGYFYNGGIVPSDFVFDADKKFLARLTLLSVQKTGRDNTTTEKPFVFKYNEGSPGGYSDIVAPVNSYFTDHWGFNNNENGYVEYPSNYNYGEFLLNNLTNASSKNPVPGLAKNGILKQVAYPLGGTLDFEYEQNQAFYAGQNKNIGGVRVKKTTLFDGSDHTKDIVMAYKYTKADGVSSSGWGFEQYTYTNNIGHRVFKQSNGKTGLPSVKDIGITAINTFINDFPKTGTLDNSIKSVAASIVIGVLFDIFSPESTEYLSTESSNIANESENPLPFMYSRVEVSNLLPGGSSNGKTVYEFTSEQETSLLKPVISFPFSSKARYAAWAYGLPKRTTVYDNAGKMLKETINQYNPIFSFISNNDNFKSKKWTPNKLIFDDYPSSHTLTLSELGNITEETYTPLTGHTELLNTKERVYYKNSNAYNETTTTYTYNPSNYQVKTSSSENSKGEKIEQRFYYPGDYTGIVSMNTLTNANLQNTVVSAEIWKNISGQDYLLDATVSDFGTTPGGDIQPIKQYGLETATPLSNATVGAFQPGSLVRNNTYFKEKVRYDYDADGNVLNSYDVTAQQYNCKLYDYDNRIPVAEVSNAKNDEVAYTSFETENQGGWQYDKNHVSAEQSPTGKRSYNISVSETIARAATTPLGRAARLSLWATAANITVNGNAPVKTGPAINGWTYYEFDLPASASNVSITGNCKIDELRLLPKAARMGTSTYEPGLGKTSVCDINNRMQYFMYDNFGRVSQVLDENRNIIKTYEYHQKN